MMGGFEGWMCATDFKYDMRGSCDGARIFPSEKAARAHLTCADECGLVCVSLSIKEPATPTDVEEE